MLALLRRFVRVILVIVGFVLVALFIWYAGPFFEFADWRPFESGTVRAYAIAAVIGGWLLWRLVKRLRAFKASDNLVAAVLKQAGPTKAPPSAEAIKLRERFEEAALTLKQKRRGGHSLYELPWYVIIGAPGSGKTTALINSGLKFPLEPRGGRALKGVGGTRNCDWWFTDDAVFLDTAGRYTTQDSDAESDSEGWAEFLALLRKYRKRRPINGVILTISAHDLMVQGDARREEHVEAARRRLIELNRELRIQLPVYLMVTKCDLVAGFTEYFDDLSHETRAQVWGVTFPYDQTRSGHAAQMLSTEFDALMERLNQRVVARVEEDRDVRRRTRVFAFPQQMAALRDPLAAFVTDVFGSSRFENHVLLRGVYLTSGTQEGTPIDRLLGAIGRGFGLGADVVAPTGGRGKAYFVERLLKQVLIGESGLAGSDTRGEAAKAAVHLGAYAAIALLATLSVVALSVSYRRNQSYLAQVAGALSVFQKEPPVAAAAAPDRLLARLNAVRALSEAANQHRDAVPWEMRWGLYQGSAIGREANAAYLREHDNLLVPHIATRLRQRVVEQRGEPERQLDALKAYLMLDDPKHLDRDFLGERVDAEWGGNTAGSPSALTFATHFRSRLADESPLPSRGLDQAVIAQARAAIQQTSVARIIYDEIRREYAEKPDSAARAVVLDRSVGRAAGLFRRKSGISLTPTLPSLYSKSVFNEITDAGSSMDLIKRYAADNWVLGNSATWMADPTGLRNKLVEYYETDYIDAWDRVLNDLELVRPDTAPEIGRMLEALSGPASPLRQVLDTIVENTRFVRSAQAAPPPSLLDKGKKMAQSLANSIQQAAGLTQPGQRITARFEAYHRAVEGEAGQKPIDRVITQLQQLNNVMTPFVASNDLIKANDDPEVQKALGSLQQESAVLPAGLRLMLEGTAANVRRVTTTAVIKDKDEQQRLVEQGERADLESARDLFRQQVQPECNRIVAGRYPFTRGSDNNLPLRDFTTLFAPGGTLDSFFTTHLAAVTDASSKPWKWRPGLAAQVLPSDMLRVFQNAADVREAFFPGGAKVPGMQFTAMVINFDQAAATRFRLEVEGAVLDSQQNTQGYTIKWPGEKPGLVRVVFDGRYSTPYTASFHGPWAWFRLLEASKLTWEFDTRNVLTVSVSGVQANIAIEAATVHNPFATPDWQRFKCGS